MAASLIVSFLLPITVTIVAFALLILVANRVDPWLVYPGSIALLGHVVMAIFVLPILPYTWDIGAFHSAAMSVLTGSSPQASSTVSSFGTFQSVVYSAFAPDPVVIAILNGLLAVLVAVAVRDLARHLYPTLQSTRGLVLVVLFLPLPFLYLTVPMRDALSVLVFFCMLALPVRSYATGDWWPALLVIPLFGILDLLRPELAFVSLVGLVGAIGVHLLRTVPREPVDVRTVVAAATPVGVVALPLVGPRVPVDKVRSQLNFRTTGGGAYLDGMTYDGWIDLVVAAPVRAVYFQFAPFPLHVSQFPHLLAALMLPILVVLAVAAYRSASRYNRDLVILAFLATTYVVGIVGYGLVDSNFGTTARHRVPFTLLLCVFAAPVFEGWEYRLRSRFDVAPERVGE